MDFSLYRPATISRKLELRLKETRSRDYREYLEYLKAHPDEFQILIRTLTIKVSNFFRNPSVFEMLRSVVIPHLVADFGFVRAWSVGCANGEEPYSVSMIAQELLTEDKLPFTFNIYGTDVDPDAIEKAKKGEYSCEELFETKKEYIGRYFRKMGCQHSGYGHERCVVNDEIRSMVQFSCGNIMDLLTDKSHHDRRFNLILSRNVLIYLNREVQEQIIASLAEKLYDRGYLVIGESETIPDASRNRFKQTCSNLKVYRKLRLSAG